jgi:predicted enzyme related to lactoylglutathione lyase
MRALQFTDFAPVSNLRLIELPDPEDDQTGYETLDLDTTLAKAKAAGARVLVEPYSAGARRSAFVQFPGGYIAEIHAPVGK